MATHMDEICGMRLTQAARRFSTTALRVKRGQSVRPAGLELGGQSRATRRGSTLPLAQLSLVGHPAAVPRSPPGDLLGDFFIGTSDKGCRN